MSVQIALGAPATRVASRKLGPVAGSRSPPSASVRGGLRDEHVGEHVRQVRDGRKDRVVRVRDRSRRGARRGCAAAGRGARTAAPEVPDVGVRYQVEPSNRSARACRTPAVSAPASGWPPTKRGSSCAATTARLVEPTSVTTQSLPAAASASTDRVRPGAPTGTATNTACASATASSTLDRRVVERRARSSALRSGVGRRVEAGDRRHRGARERRARSSRRSGRRR